MDAYPRVGEAHSEAEVVHPGAVEANPELWKLILKARGHSDAINSHPETVEALTRALDTHFEVKVVHPRGVLEGHCGVMKGHPVAV